MSVNYTPNQNKYKDIGSFRFWCQKVLPLVYDDSLSYYELLNKVVQYLNDTIENVDLVGDDMTKVYTAYKELQNWVNGYFDNLNVQNEINEKLDLLANDGTLSNLIYPYITQNVAPSFVNTVGEMTNKNRVYVLSTDNMIYTYNSSTGAFTGTGAYFTIPQNALFNYGSSFTETDLNEIIECGYTYVNGTADTILNAPNYSANGIIRGWLLTYYHDTSAVSLMQIFMYVDGMMYVRGYRGAWVAVNQESFTFNDTVTSLNFDTVYKAGYIFVNGLSADMTNPPKHTIGGKIQGWLLTYYTPRTANTQVQMFIYVDGTVYVRPYNGEWSLLGGKGGYNTDLRVAVFGDSIFGSGGTTISHYMSQYLGCVCYDVGFGGTRLVGRATTGVQYFDFTNLVDAIVSGDYTNQIANQTANSQQDFTTNLNTLMSLDFSEIDVVTLGFGTNDYTAGVEVEAFGNSVKTIVDKLTEKYPNLRVVFITPLWRYFRDLSVGGDENIIKGQTLNHFVEILKERCYDSRVPCLDAYHTFNLNKYNQGTITTDGLHLNTTGKKLFAKMISGFINTII